MAPPQKAWGERPALPPEQLFPLGKCSFLTCPVLKEAHLLGNDSSGPSGESARSHDFF